MKRRNRMSTATVDEGGVDRIAEELDPRPVADEQLLANEERAQMHECVGRLPESEREVVRLQLAEITQAPLNTVLGRMRNATRRLRECMEGSGEIAR